MLNGTDDGSAQPVAELLQAWGSGEKQALTRLVPMVYGERRRISYGHAAVSLQPTALVNEVDLRLVGAYDLSFHNRSQFFALAAQMMRGILVDAARARGTSKRGGTAEKLSFEEADFAAPGREREIVALDDALTALSRLDARKARAVELRFFGGLTIEETAESDGDFDPDGSQRLEPGAVVAGACDESNRNVSSTPDRWQSIEALYQAAMDLPADQRAAFLKEATAENGLRREVESLLGYAPDDALLDRSPWATPANLGHYVVGQKIGAGGMGEVYKGRDSRLGRDVALKVLPAGMMGDPNRRARFMREAQSASRLNHPNIVTIYHVGESEGRVYIAMEYVAGKTLDALIPRGGLPWADTVKYAVPITGALAMAHAAGIVHRDLKPANIMVTPESVVKILRSGKARGRAADARE